MMWGPCLETGPDWEGSDCGCLGGSPWLPQVADVIGFPLGASLFVVAGAVGWGSRDAQLCSQWILVLSSGEGSPLLCVGAEVMAPHTQCRVMG